MLSLAGGRHAVQTACLVVSALLCVQHASAEPQAAELEAADRPLPSATEPGSTSDATLIWVADRTFETGEDVTPSDPRAHDAPDAPAPIDPGQSWEEIFSTGEPAPEEPAPQPAPGRTHPTGALVPTRADGLAYTVSSFEIEYAEEHPDHPPIEELRNLEVELLRTEDGYVAPRFGAPTERIRIGGSPDAPPVPYYGSAIRAVGAAIVQEYNRRGLIGALVIPSSEDVDARSSRDLRPPERTEMGLVVWTGHLAEQRTFASGSRYSDEDRVDNPAHAGIKERSPIQPGDLLDKGALDEYVARLNRHPGRSVDVAITRASQPGNVYLDYLVAENPRPWTAYAQVSDTGTEGTGDWRQRFGFGHTQLTGHDDLLQVDYITSGFDDLNAVFGSYEIPLGFVSREVDRVSARVQGSWSEFDASEVGFQNAHFEGKQYHAGGQMIVNLYQLRDWFFDAYTGARYQHIWNKNEPVDNLPDANRKGTTNFFIPELGARVEHDTQKLTFLAGMSGEINVPDVAGTKSSDFDNGQMGRNDVTEDSFKIMRWLAATSFFLDPLLQASEGVRPTRAAELFFSTQGQFTDDRLIPYLQAVAGGLNTVRGYPQSKAAGDTAALWRAEFRLHLPRLLRVQPDPIELPWGRTFYVAPPQPYGQPDWDLIVRPFIDGATLFNNDNIEGEEGQIDMIGTGVGLELQLYNNLIVRGDWGRAQSEALGTHKGHDSFYFSFTFVL